jgi:hypothetical protein
MPIAEQLAPSRVSHRGRALSRSDNIGEHHSSEHAIRLRPPPLAGDELLDMVRDNVLRLNV